MKKIALITLCLVSILACKQEQKSEDYKNAELNVTTTIYPENISKVFDAHGGIDTWNAMQTLEFTMPKDTGDEVTFTDLHSRKSLIKMPNHTIGYDGSDVWLQSNDTTTYKGNPKFYYNLMFYFYAMPFVLGDDGINYADVEPLEFEGVSYPGILISYEAGVGESPDDEYILYYHPETFKMEWLGYTVTYFSQEKAKEFHFIKYSDWQDVNGLQLPKTLTWYNYENNTPTTLRNVVDFVNVKLTKEPLNDDMFKAKDTTLIVK